VSKEASHSAAHEASADRFCCQQSSYLHTDIALQLLGELKVMFLVSRFGSPHRESQGEVGIERRKAAAHVPRRMYLKLRLVRIETSIW